jgi:hypothetical protein
VACAKHVRVVCGVREPNARPLEIAVFLGNKDAHTRRGKPLLLDNMVTSLKVGQKRGRRRSLAITFDARDATYRSPAASERGPSACCPAEVKSKGTVTFLEGYVDQTLETDDQCSSSATAVLSADGWRA